MRCYSLFRNFAPPFALEQVGMEATACFPTNENVFIPLRVAKIVFDYSTKTFSDASSSPDSVAGGETAHPLTTNSRVD
jgi:hypothetical protein